MKQALKNLAFARRTTGVLLIFAVLFGSASLLTFHPAEVPGEVVGVQPTVENLCGPLGVRFAFGLLRWFGLGGYLLMVVCGGWGVTLLASRRITEGWLRLVGSVLLVAVVSVITALPGTGSILPLATGNGGLIGEFLAEPLRRNVNLAGGYLVLIFAGGVALILINDRAVMGTVRLLGRVVVLLWSHAASWRRQVVAEEGVRRLTVRSHRRRSGTWVEGTGSRGRKGHPSTSTSVGEGERATTSSAPPAPAASPSSIPVRVPRKPEPTERPAFSAELDTPGRAPDSRYELPPIDLLDEPDYSYAEAEEENIRKNAITLVNTLREFGVDVRVVACETGPVITQYEVELSPGTRVQKIFTLANDIAIALKSPPIRIVAPIPGKDTIGIEVPNRSKEIVRLRELLECPEARRRHRHIPLFLGKDASGNPLIYDLTQMPHLLIAGRTGSGKSVCINAAILSILFTRTPDEVKLLLVDPKMVELAAFKKIPHLISPVVTDMKKAAAVLQWAVSKMDERYDLLARAGVRDIAGYNRLGPEGIARRFADLPEDERARVPDHMPYLVILVDELADLMMIAGKEVEDAITRLAQKSRSVGIHIVLATQRPSADVITGLIKANLPSRIAFQVSSKLESRIIVDQNGAETLLGAGDMLFLPPTSAELIRAQGTYVSDEEIRRVVDFIRRRAEPEFSRELMQVRTEIETRNNRLKNYHDDLYEEAVRIILEAQRGSLSLLQRRLGIGYGRAARLIDMMAEDGIVGDYQGSQAREVLMTLEEWEASRKQEK